MEKIYNINKIKKLCKPIFEKYKIGKAYLFGSYARGEANKNSDIDIMITKTGTFTLMDLSELAIKLKETLDKEIDIITEETYTEDIKYDDNAIKKLKQEFYNNIKKEMVQIYG